MGRLVLGFDTATAAVAVAIGRWPDDASGAPTVIAARDTVAWRASLSLLLPTVRDLLEGVGLAPADIELVAVGRGPGSYTGVRIGMAAAKGVAQGLGVSICGVGTLDAVAWGLLEADGLVGVVGDAMRQEVYPALFSVEQGVVRRLTDDRVADPGEAARRWAVETEGPILLVGDGLAKYVDVFLESLGDRASIAPQGTWLPSGAGVLSAAWAADARATGAAGDVLPVYTALSDAERAERGRDEEVPSSGVGGPVEEGTTT